MMAASGSGGNNLMTYHEFVAAEQLQQAAEGKTKNFLRNKQHSTIIRPAREARGPEGPAR